jgi:hypothetical protein
MFSVILNMLRQTVDNLAYLLLFPSFSPLIVTFPKLSVILRPLYIRLTPDVERAQFKHFKNSPATRHGDAWGGGGRRYSSHSFLTSTLAGGEQSASLPGRALAREKNSRYPLNRRLGGPQSQSGHRGYWKNSFPCRGLNPARPVDQSVARHYTELPRLLI